jgi:DNA modification methylase
MTWTIHEGDCLDPVSGLASLPDLSIDVAILDPPYSEHVHECGRRGFMRPEPGKGKAGFSRNRELGFEAIVVAHRPGRKRWNGGGKAGLYTCPIVLNRGGKDTRCHTTQKPLRLMESLVRDFTDQGELILDPFAGSGTTGVACRRLGRSFVGWERDPKYAAIARRRIEAAREQVELFAARGPKPKQLGLDLGAAA